MKTTEMYVNKDEQTDQLNTVEESQTSHKVKAARRKTARITWLLLHEIQAQA